MAKFGVMLPQEGVNYSDIRSVALEAERLGFDLLMLNDHLHPTYVPTHESFWEGWVTLSALATEARRIRLGTLATCVLFRPPTLVAKMAATFDQISGGRLEFGMGAGWFEAEAVAYGIPFPRPGKRLGHLREALQIVREMWTHDRVSFEGKFYTVKEAFCSPKPLQKPHPPIWTGILKTGEYMLRLAAQNVDVVNFGMRSNVDAEGFAEKTKVIGDFAASVGRSPKDIKISGTRQIIIGKNEDELRNKVEKLRGSESEEEFRRLRIVGTPDECVEQVRDYLRAGVEYFLCFFPDVTKSSNLRLFGEEVAPQLR